METVTDFIFLGSKIAADGEVSNEIKRHLLLGRKQMINLDSILKSRDITSQTNVHIDKAMIFPVVMYGCKNWTIKKAEHQIIDAFELCCWEKTLQSPLNYRNIKPVLKESSPKYSLEWLMLKLKLQYFGHLIQRADSWEKTLMLSKTKGRRRRGWQRMVGWHHWLNGYKFEQSQGESEGQGSLACCSPWGLKELAAVEWLNNNNNSSHSAFGTGCSIQT